MAVPVDDSETPASSPNRRGQFVCDVPVRACGHDAGRSREQGAEAPAPRRGRARASVKHPSVRRRCIDRARVVDRPCRDDGLAALRGRPPVTRPHFDAARRVPDLRVGPRVDDDRPLYLPGGRPDRDRCRAGGLPCLRGRRLGAARRSPAAGRCGRGNDAFARAQQADPRLSRAGRALLGYELLLVATAAPNNWDGFTYHLPRVAAWIQHGGIYWIANLPSDILNTRQPVAEQQILFLFATLGKGRFFSLPQYLAQIAGLVAVYGASRRLGFDARVAACTARTSNLNRAAAAPPIAVHAATRAPKRAVAWRRTATRPASCARY